MKSFLKIFLIPLAGIAVLYRIKNNADGLLVFEYLIDTALYCFAIAVALFTILADMTSFRKERKAAAFAGTIACVLVATVCAAVQCYYYRREHVPVLVYANYDGDYNGTSVALRIDGTYQVNNYCMGNRFFYGKYQLRDSLVTLDKDNIDNVVARRLVIRKSAHVMVQVDAAGRELSGYDHFDLVKDDRARR